MRVGQFGILMYHEIQATGAPPRESSPGYLRYVVRQEEFLTQLAALRAAGVRGVGLSTLLAGSSGEHRIAISFDDGSASDRSVAAGCLRDCDFGATFFLVSGWLGRPGYLTPGAVRELCGLGFEIGSHSMQHRFLTELAPDELRQDLAQSKQELEAISGRAVTALSCPGGRWSRAVAETAREVGYTAVATSRLGLNDATTDRLELARIVIRRGTDEREFRRRASGLGLGAERLRGVVLGGMRSLVGNALYDRLRRRLAR